MSTLALEPLIAVGVVLATALTDAAYVMFTSAVIARKRVPAASWSSIWYLLSSFCGDQLHQLLGLCLLCRLRLLDRRLRLDDSSAPACSRGADGVRARVARFRSEPVFTTPKQKNAPPCSHR
jgi:hypothetical protein